MKDRMKLWDRILLILYAVLGIAVTVALAAALLSGMEIRIFGLTLSLNNGVAAFAVVLGAALVLVAWPLRLLVVALRRTNKSKKQSVAVQNTEDGAVRISLQAMDTLVRQAIGEADGVENVESTIINHDDSISVNVDMTLRSDVHIPNVTTLMQRSIKGFIEKFSGISVRDVTVMVSKVLPAPVPQLTDAIAAEPAKAVEAPKESSVEETDFAQEESEDGQEPEAGKTDFAQDEPEDVGAAEDQEADAADETSPEEAVQTEENENSQIGEKDIW